MSTNTFRVTEDCYVVLPVFNLNRARTIKRETMVSDDPVKKDVFKETKIFQDRAETKWIECFYSKHRNRIKRHCIHAGFGLITNDERKRRLEQMVQDLKQEIADRNLQHCSLDLKILFFKVVAENTAAVEEIVENVHDMLNTLTLQYRQDFDKLETARQSTDSSEREELLKAIDIQSLKKLSASLQVGRDVIVNNAVKDLARTLEKDVERLISLRKDMLEELKKSRFTNLLPLDTAVA